MEVMFDKSGLQPHQDQRVKPRENSQSGLNLLPNVSILSPTCPYENNSQVSTPHPHLKTPNHERADCYLWLSVQVSRQFVQTQTAFTFCP